MRCIVTRVIVMNANPDAARPALLDKDKDADAGPKTVTVRQETKVGWFDVRQVFATTAMMITSVVVGSMSGRRELMAALDPRPPDTPQLDHDYSDEPKVWFDYVADTGDGWDATYSIAYLAGRDALYLRNDGLPTPQPISGSGTEEAPAPGDPSLYPLEAGYFLIFGGDEVYPAASNQAYLGRLQDPFGCARFWDAKPRTRHLYAIPGNHDWYDGLTAFIRLFCQKRHRWMGAWQTQQRRSYFAIRLPYRWWLWGVDLALEEDLDPPQLDYFASQAEMLQPGDRVILCLPNPTWVVAHSSNARQQRAVEREVNKFACIEELVRAKQARIALTIAGDLHHYARHETTSEPRTSLVTCGGGGAYMLGTSRQPKSLDLPGGQTADLRATFPTEDESRRMRWGALLFTTSSPGFAFLLMSCHMLLFYLLHSSSRIISLLDTAGGEMKLTWMEILASTPLGWREFPSVLWDAFQFMAGDPLTVIFVLGLIGASAAFAHKGSAPGTGIFKPIGIGGLHGLLQLSLGIACCWLVASLSASFSEPGTWPFVIAFTLMSLSLVFIVSGTLFGAYLLLGNLFFEMHEQEVFSCQAITKYKCFLRIHIDKEKATVYPVGLRQPGTRWTRSPGVILKSATLFPNLSREEVLTVPPLTTRIYDPIKALEPHLIEPPIDIH